MIPASLMTVLSFFNNWVRVELNNRKAYFDIDKLLLYYQYWLQARHWTERSLVCNHSFPALMVFSSYLSGYKNYRKNSQLLEFVIGAVLKIRPSFEDGVSDIRSFLV